MELVMEQRGGESCTRARVSKPGVCTVRQPAVKVVVPQSLVEVTNRSKVEVEEAQRAAIKYICDIYPIRHKGAR